MDAMQKEAKNLLREGIKLYGKEVRAYGDYLLIYEKQKLVGKVSVNTGKIGILLLKTGKKLCQYSHALFCKYRFMDDEYRQKFNKFKEYSRLMNEWNAKARDHIREQRQEQIV